MITATSVPDLDRNLPNPPIGSEPPPPQITIPGEDQHKSPRDAPVPITAGRRTVGMGMRHPQHLLTALPGPALRRQLLPSRVKR